MKRLLAAALLTLAIAGCPDFEEDGADVSAPLISKVCARQAECCPKNESVAACESSTQLVLEPLFTMNGIAIDQAKLDACVAKMNGASCDEVAGYGGMLPTFTYCEQFWSGTLGLGESCGGDGLLASLYGDDQCASGQCVGGKCVAKAKLGESCGEVECDAGLTCGLDEHKCVAPLATGATCSSSWDCAEGAGCVSSGEARTCQPLTVIQIGEECGSGTVCALGESMCYCPVGSEGCSTGVCGNTSRCQQ